MRRLPQYYHGLLTFFVLLLTISSTVFAQLELPLIFQSGMVLQRDQQIPFSGKGNASGYVVVRLNNISDSSLVNPEGNWKVELPPMSAGGPYILEISQGDETIQLDNIYLGDVWLASGQSNMQMTLGECDPPSDEISSADNMEIRQFMVQRSLKNEPSATLPSGSAWTPATSANSPAFTAVGYYFARYLYKEYEIPIGIINCSFGGTRVESWMSQGMLGYDEGDIVFGSGESWLQATVAYNAMLHPLIGTPIKGILWYQGESNAGSREEATMYRATLKKMITSWRELWGQGDIPFISVQLPNYNTPANEDSPGSWDAWPLMRESQASILDLPNTEFSVSIDVGDLDIHPTNKEPVGKRVALAARHLVYNENIVYSGPRYESHRSLGDGKVEISFSHTDSGLVALNSENQVLKWFSIVSPGGSIVKADAVLDSNKVIVWNTNISTPFAIRYAWETNPADVNFYNTAGLPAAPFFIHVEDQGFSIGNYNTSDANIDRGESTLLRWEVFGADSVKLNGLPVEAKSGARIWPIQDSTFTLSAYKEGLNEINKSIKISVRQPIPTISLIGDTLGIVPLDSTIEFQAVVSAEGGEAISYVEFYLNNVLMGSDSEAPYEWTWTATMEGIQEIMAIVYNGAGLSSNSTVKIFTVKELEFDRYEAEDARYASGVIRRADPAVSGAYYLDLKEGWTVNFDSVRIDSSESCLLLIRYRLNYGSPNVQHLLLNGEFYSSLYFTAEDTRSWNNYMISLPLDSGFNKISIDGFWDYMSLDYIEAGHTPFDEIVDTTTVDTSSSIEKLRYFRDLSIYPNPFENEFYLDYALPVSDEVHMDLLDIAGRIVRNIKTPDIKGVGLQKIDAADLDPGIYFLRIRYGKHSQTVMIKKTASP